MEKSRGIVVRRCAEFESDLPTDTIEMEEEIIVGGRSVGEAIGQILESLGARADPPVYAGDNGWQFQAYFQGRTFFCQATHIERFMFLLEDASSRDRSLHRYSPIYLDLLTRLAEALARDPRFHDIGWHADEDVLSGSPGAAMPVEGWP